MGSFRSKPRYKKCNFYVGIHLFYVVCKIKCTIKYLFISPIFNVNRNLKLKFGAIWMKNVKGP